MTAAGAGGSAPGGLGDFAFHDYLGLGGGALPDRGALVFQGRSGSGKSTYIRWLLERHSDLPPGELSVVDEVLRLRDLVRVARRMRRSRLTLVASHLPPVIHAVLRPLGPVLVFRLDRRPEKIRRWLRARGVVFGEGALGAFCDLFGANYTDAAIVLERYPGLTFDEAFRRFRRECRVVPG